MVIDIPPVKVFIAPIEPLKGENKRQAERRCVDRLISGAFGQGATLLHDPDGRPTIEGAEISVSHCRRYAALAVAPAGVNVGVDIEDNADRAARVISRVLRGPYAAMYASPDTALAAWTLLEAAFKCVCPNRGLTLVDFHLPNSTGGLEGKNISLPVQPTCNLTILASRPLPTGIHLSVVIRNTATPGAAVS